jgi:hypothetical protein
MYVYTVTRFAALIHFMQAHLLIPSRVPHPVLVTVLNSAVTAIC